MIVARAELISAMGLGSTLSPQDAGLLNFIQPWVERAIKNYVHYEVEDWTGTHYFPDRGLYTPLDMLIEGYEGASGRAVPIERFRSDNRLITMLNLPVRQIVTVYEFQGAWDTAVNGVPVFPSSSQLFEGNDWQLDIRGQDSSFPGYIEGTALSFTGFLFRRTGVWTNVERAISVTYRAGYTAQELDQAVPDFKMSVLEAVMQNFNQIKSHRWPPGVVIAEKLSDWGATYDAEAMRKNYGLELHLPVSVLRRLEGYVHYGKAL